MGGLFSRACLFFGADRPIFWVARVGRVLELVAQLLGWSFFTGVSFFGVGRPFFRVVFLGGLFARVGLFWSRSRNFLGGPF